MGKLGTDAKNLILGNDGSDKEPVDFKTELQAAIKSGIISKADGTLLITSRENCEKLANLIVKSEEKEITEASKENGIEFDTLEEAKQYEEDKEKKKKDKKEKEQQRALKAQEKSLEEQILESQNEAKAKISSEKNLEKEIQIERK